MCDQGLQSWAAWWGLDVTELALASGFRGKGLGLGFTCRATDSFEILCVGMLRQV